MSDTAPIESGHFCETAEPNCGYTPCIALVDFDSLDDRDTVWWCKDLTDHIVESVTTAYEGHMGHVKCIRVAATSGGYRQEP